MFDLPHVSFDRDALRRQLQSIARDSSLAFEHDGRRFFAPRTVAELTELRAAYPRATILAGNTDVGLWVTKQLRELPEIIFIGNVDELKAHPRRRRASFASARGRRSPMRTARSRGTIPN